MPTAFTILVCSSILQAPFCTSCLFIACFAVSYLGDSITSVLLLFIVCLLPHFPQFLRVWGETRPLPLHADLNIHQYLCTLTFFHATQKTAWLWWPWIPWRLRSTVIATSVVPTNAAESSFKVHTDRPWSHYMGLYNAYFHPWTDVPLSCMWSVVTLRYCCIVVGIAWYM